MSCKHSSHGFCSKCAELKPYLQFKLCKDKCFSCKNCGYFWGPAHELNGQPVVFKDKIK